MKILLQCFLILLATDYLLGQSDPIKFGKFSKEEIEMKVYPLDSSAGAVVLYDFGTAARGSYTRHTRIKILKPSGFEHANFAIGFFAIGRVNLYNNLKASTFNFDGDNVVETKLKAEEMYDDRVNTFILVKKIPMPAVKTGSIIEITYTLPFFGIPEWEFQSMIPTRWSELSVSMTGLKLQRYLQGYHPVSVYDATSQGSFHLISKDVPAFKDEPYMSTREDYLSKLRIGYSTVYLQDPTYSEANRRHFDFPEVRIIESWADLNKLLLSDRGYLAGIKGSSNLKEDVHAIIDSTADPLENIKKLSFWVKEKVAWDSTDNTRGSDPRDVLKKKKGSSGDINLLLGSLLDKAGFEVDIVLLSTRDHGFVHIEHPMQEQFNYSVCAVHLADKTILLDATDRFLPFDVLPERCYNGDGLIISKKWHGWHRITVKGKSRTAVSAKLNLKENGIMEGDVAISCEGFDALDKKWQFYRSPKEELIRKMSVEKGWEVLKHELPPEEPNGSNSWSASIKCIVDRAAEVQGDKIYVNPFVDSQLKSNPFKSPTRLFPVSFGHPFEQTYLLNLSIPGDMTIEDMPKPRIVTLPGNSAKYIFNMTRIGNSINLISTFTINKPMFLPEEYEHLRAFYDEVVAIQSSSLVLGKK